MVLVLFAALADARGLGGLGTLLLVAAVPAAAAAALTVFGELVQLPARARGVAAARVESALGAIGLATIVVAAAARAGAVDGAGVPPLAVSAVVVCVGAYALQAFVALWAPFGRGDVRERPRVPAAAAEQAEPAQAA